MVGRLDVAEGRWAARQVRRLAAGAIVFAAGVSAILPAAARAAPTWLSPQNVFSPPVTSIQDDPFFNRKALDVVTDSGGNSVAVWIEQHPKVPGPGTECRAM